jgi:hypothetical protein
VTGVIGAIYALAGIDEKLESRGETGAELRCVTNTRKMTEQ